MSKNKQGRFLFAHQKKTPNKKAAEKLKRMTTFITTHDVIG
jgi:hypothetical protein